MNATFSIAVHNDDLPTILPLVPSPHKTSPCGAEWTVISSDISEGRFDDGALREAVKTLNHVSVFEAEAGEGRVHIENIDDSPLFTYNSEPLDPFSQPVLYEVLEGDWSNEIGRDETVDATTARNLFLNGEVVYLSVFLPDDMASIGERLVDLDSRFVPEQSPDIHDLL